MGRSSSHTNSPVVRSDAATISFTSEPHGYPVSLNISRAGFGKRRWIRSISSSTAGSGRQSHAARSSSRLGHAGCADDGACHEPASIHEGQRQRRGRHTALPGKRRMGLRCLTHVRFGIADAEILEQIDTPSHPGRSDILRTGAQRPAANRRAGRPAHGDTALQSNSYVGSAGCTRSAPTPPGARPSSPANHYGTQRCPDARSRALWPRTPPSSTRVAAPQVVPGRGGRSFASGVITAAVRTSRLIAGRPVQLVEIDLPGGAGSPPAQRLEFGGIEASVACRDPAQVARRPLQWWRQDLFAGLVFSQAPTIRSLAPLVGARAGTGYISAVSMKFPPAQSQIRLRMRFCRAVLLARS